VGSEDEQWRRPTAFPEGATSDRPPAEPPRRADGYEGPPRSAPRPPDWRPPHVLQPAPPRQLPPQSHDRLDADEGRARTFTLGVGMITAAVLLIVVIVLCTRALF
jgi:hypothetical protein